MLVDGLDHVAVITSDTDRLHDFYKHIFGAEVVRDDALPGGGRLSFVRLGRTFALNVFELPDSDEEARRAAPMFHRGRLDHLGVRAADMTAFRLIRERLVTAGASDGFVTNFGPVLSVFFSDPDGLEAEVCVDNPNAVPGVFHPPGTAAEDFA